MKRETSPDRQVKGGRRGLGACEVRRKAVGGGGGGQGARGVVVVGGSLGLYLRRRGVRSGEGETEGPSVSSFVAGKPC